ncbi:PAS domain S-box protein [Christiangramia sp.]|uniref:PAS domain-containing protein n=1 Tax=Christiangramia sp. TaxID=1931228 RepID=UPI0026283163|nr:PAS domain S-box protein [Christiangramia sp.]
MELYNEIFEKLPLPCLLLEPQQGNIIIKNTNQAYLQLALKKRDEVVGFELPECLPASFLKSDFCFNKLLASIDEVFQKGKQEIFGPIKLEKENPGSDSIEKYLSLELLPVKLEEKRDALVLMTFLDRTAEIQLKREQKIIEKKLGGNLVNHGYFIEHSVDGLYSLDLEGNFINVNEGLANMADMSVQELKNMSFIPFCATYDRDRVLDHFLKAAKGEKQELQADFFSFKGRKFSVQISLAPMEIKGEIKGVYGIAKDITEKLQAQLSVKQTQERLLKNEKKFKALVQEASDLIAILDLEGNFKFSTESSYSVLQISPEEFIGRNAFEFIHPEDQERLNKNLMEIQHEKQLDIPAFRFMDGGGNWRWLESKATNLIDSPEVEGIVINSRDITAEMNQKKEMKELYDRQNFALMATGDLIYDWDILNNKSKRNKVFERKYGYNLSDYSGLAWMEIIDKRDRVEVKNKFEEALKNPLTEKVKVQYRLLKSNGKIAYVMDRAYILRNENGEATRVVGAILDMSRHKKLLKKTETQNKVLKETAWEQAHVLRGPVVRLQALIGCLEQQQYEIWEREELIQLISFSAKEVDDIIMNRIKKIENTNV